LLGLLAGLLNLAMASSTELKGLAVSMRDCVDTIADSGGDGAVGAGEVGCETVGTVEEVAVAVAAGIGWEMPRIASRTELNGLDVSQPGEVEAGAAWAAATSTDVGRRKAAEAAGRPVGVASEATGLGWTAAAATTAAAAASPTGGTDGRGGEPGLGAATNEGEGDASVSGGGGAGLFSTTNGEGSSSLSSESPSSNSERPAAA
jgi:hypothetical protein